MNLGEDVVFQILLLLPVLSLLRFKCVCKEWCALIKSCMFKDTYLALRRARSVDDRICCLMGKVTEEDVDQVLELAGNGDAESIVKYFRVPDRRRGKISFSSWYDDYQTLEFFIMDQLSSVDIEVPFNPNGLFRLINHVGGIICIFNGNNWFDLFLVNPALREFRKLPWVDLEGFKCETQGIGFGYDDATNEHKVVAIVTVYEEDSLESPFKHICLVYRLSTNSWTILGDISPFVSNCYVSKPNFIGMSTLDEVIFSHGSIHWCMLSSADEPDYQILAFNLTNETFQEMKFPCDWRYPPLFSNDTMFPHLFTVDNSTIALVASSHTNYDRVHPIEVWEMKEYGDSDSWTKQYSISYLPRFRKALSFWKRDYLLIELESDHLACYDLCKYQLCDDGECYHHARLFEDDRCYHMYEIPLMPGLVNLEVVTGHESFVSVKQV